MIEALRDDLNTPLALSRVFAIDDPGVLRASAQLLGLLSGNSASWFKFFSGGRDAANLVEARIAERAEAKARRNFGEADRIRDELKAEGVLLEDGPEGTIWRRA